MPRRAPKVDLDTSALGVEEKRLASFDGTDLAYHTLGQGPPILLANGLGGSWRAWKHQLRYFRDRYSFVSWDYRGLYASKAPPDRHALDVPAQARDGLAILDLPLVFGRVSLTPGLGVGVGWLSGRDQGFGAFGHQDDAGLAPRAELHLMASVRLSERLSLELGAAGTVAPSFGHHRELMGDSHLAIVRGQAGLVWGIP